MSTLGIEGEVAHPRALGFSDLAGSPGQVADVSRLVPGRSGRAVRLEDLLLLVAPAASATHLTLVSSDGFSANVPLEAVRHGVVLYAEPGGEALPPPQGGPFRFLVPEAEGCALDEVSHCSNVKRLATLRLTAGAERDTRPRSADDHAELHARERMRGS